MSGETLRIERAFQAPAKAVFDAWTSEEVLRRWFHAEHDWETPEAQVDLRLGGAVRVVMRNPHKDTEHGGSGRYTEIDPPTRLGVELDPAQCRGAAAIFARWWRRADPVLAAKLEWLASLPVERPPGKGKSQGPTLPLSGAEDLEAILCEDLATAASSRYWIKANYHRHDREDWWTRGWISDRRRASYAIGDLLFLYLSARDGGPARCPVVVRAMTAIRHDPSFVLAEGDAEAIPQWPSSPKHSASPRCCQRPKGSNWR